MNRKIFALCATLVFILACWIIQAGEKHSEAPSSEQSSSSEPPSTVQLQDSDSARKDIAVIVDGEDALQANTAEARIVSFLIQNGYSLADEGKMRAVKADAAKYQAVSLAKQENYSAVIRLIADYSLAGVVLASVLEGQARENAFALFTGGASVRLFAVTSSVTKMGGQTSSSI